MKFDLRDVGFGLMTVGCVIFFIRLVITNHELIDLKNSTTPDYQGYESAYNNCLTDLTE